MAFMERISVIVDAKVDGFTSGFKKMKADIREAEGVTAKFKAGFSGMAAGVKANAGLMAVGAGTAVLAFADDVIEAGLAMEQMDAKAEAVFGGSIGLVRDWASENAAAMGLTERAAVGAAAAIADLLKPMGFTADEAARQSVEITNLSGALAAWSAGKYDAAQVSEILSKAMLGEREQLKSLGISITEADVSARLLENGQKGLTGAALAQAKALATQQLIMEKSTDAQKAWTDGSMDGVKAANKSKAKFAELSDSLMEALYPALEGLVPLAGDVAAGLVPVIEVLAGIADIARELKPPVSSQGLIEAEINAERVGKAFLKTAMATREGIKSMQDFEEALYFEQISLEDAERATNDLATATTTAAGELVWLSDAGDRGADGINYVDRAAVAAEASLDEMDDTGRSVNEMLADQRKRLDDVLESMYDLEKATMSTEEAYADYVAMLNEANTANEDGSITLADLRDGQIDVAEGALDVARKFAQEKGAVDGSKESYELMRQSLIKQQEQYPLLAAEIQKYIDKLGQIPGTVNTNVQINNGNSGPSMVSGGGPTGAPGQGAPVSGQTGNLGGGIESVGGGRSSGSTVNVYISGPVMGGDQMVVDMITRAVNDGVRAGWMAV